MFHVEQSKWADEISPIRPLKASRVRSTYYTRTQTKARFRAMPGSELSSLQLVNRAARDGTALWPRCRARWLHVQDGSQPALAPLPFTSQPRHGPPLGRLPVCSGSSRACLVVAQPGPLLPGPGSPFHYVKRLPPRTALRLTTSKRLGETMPLRGRSVRNEPESPHGQLT